MSRLDWTGIGEQAIGGAIGATIEGITGLIQNHQNAKIAGLMQERNYQFGEMQADNADRRTRALYYDLYAPEAKVTQLEQAGLNPALMYSGAGAGGQSSTAGAQGGSVNVGAPQMQNLGLMEGALMASEIKLNQAQANKLNAEAEDKNLDVKGKQREWEWSEKHAVEEVTINVNNERITELRDTGKSKWEIKRELEYKRDKAFNYLEKNRFDNENWLEVYRGITNQDSKDNIIEEYKSKLNLLKNQELQSEFETKLQEYKKKSVTDLLDLMKNGINTGNKTVDAVLKSAIPIMVMSMLKQ